MTVSNWEKSPYSMNFIKWGQVGGSDVVENISAYLAVEFILPTQIGSFSCPKELWWSRQSHLRTT